MTCKHDCPPAPALARRLHNRPGLAAIDYRLLTYSRARAHMLALLNQEPVLRAWTHRGADDPGIALLEGNALIGDVLSFYQNLYANQAFLRSAGWDSAVAELVQLTGYRLAPGVGGEALFAVEVKGESAVTVPRGFRFKAKLAGREQEDEFESVEETTAWPHLGTFRLYRKPQPPAAMLKGERQLELLAIGGDVTLAARRAVDLRAGDRVMLVPDSSMFDVTGTAYSNQAPAEIHSVESVEVVLDRVLITFEGSLRHSRGSAIRAFKLGRSFSHFGHDAPRRVTFFDGVTTRVEATRFERNIYGSFADESRSPSASGLSPAPPPVTLYSGFAVTEMALDQEVDDLAVGGRLICEGIADFEDHTAPGNPPRSNRAFVVVKTVEAVRSDAVVWGNVQGSTGIVTLDAKLHANEDIWYETMDLRRTRFHEALGGELTLGAARRFTAGAFVDGALQFFGTYAEARALAQRDLLVLGTRPGEVQRVAVTTTLDQFAAQLPARNEVGQWTWDLTLGQPPGLPREAFDQREPRASVHGNLVFCTQGKSEPEAVLGSGDQRSVFQTFVLGKAPLTFLLDETSTPAEVPELSVYVAGVLWQRVETLFGQAGDARVYIVRQDTEGKSYVQFGDGKTGARLPSGRNNVTARYRTGNAAAGDLEAGKQPAAAGKLPALEKVLLPGSVVGGDEPESRDNAREAAPQRMQSLGRLVGLADFEAEALAIPGVRRVRADWAAPQGVPLVHLVVLTTSATTAALDKVRDTLQGYNRCRGAARYPIAVERGLLHYVYLSLRVGFEASRKPEDVERAIKLALGIVGEEGDGIDTAEGLFSWQRRRFGQNVHRSQILAAVQNVAGVTWVEIDDAQRLVLGTPPETDPLALGAPVTPATAKVVGCAPNRLLALHREHFELSLTKDLTEQECAT